MDNFIYEYKTKVIFGNGSAKNNLANELEKYGKNIMVAYGGGSIKANGIYQEVIDILNKAGKTVIDFSGIMSNPTYAKVQDGAKLAKEKNVDFILAVGGGSVIDCCKIICAQACSDEDIWTMEFEKGQLPAKMLPMGAIVTASGTGAEMNCGAVITNEEKNIKTGVLGATPVFAILEPDYTKTVPYKQVISGAFDTLSHALETYLGTSGTNHVSDDVALAIMKNTVNNIRVILKDPNNMEARANLMWDSAMAENGILKIGRKTDFQVHQIEHQLGAYTDCNHGQGLAVIQPVYCRHIVNDSINKFTKFAKEVFNEDNANKGVDAFFEFVKECGLPTKMNELDSKKEITPELLKQVANSCNIIKTNPRELTHEEIYDILLECI